jgi:hypothetical protein
VAGMYAYSITPENHSKLEFITKSNSANKDIIFEIKILFSPENH